MEIYSHITCIYLIDVYHVTNADLIETETYSIDSFMRYYLRESINSCTIATCMVNGNNNNNRILTSFRSHCRSNPSAFRLMQMRSLCMYQYHQLN